MMVLHVFKKEMSEKDQELEYYRNLKVTFYLM